MPAKSRDAQTPNRLSARLKSLHELAAETRRREREISDQALVDLREGNAHLNARLIHLRRLELQAWTLTPAEREELRQLDREYQADHDDYNAGDWTK